MRKIAIIKNDDDYRQAQIWRSMKLSVYVVQWCDEKSENWKSELFTWTQGQETEASKALIIAVKAAFKYAGVKEK